MRPARCMVGRGSAWWNAQQVSYGSNRLAPSQLVPHNPDGYCFANCQKAGEEERDSPATLLFRFDCKQDLRTVGRSAGKLK